LSALNLGAYPPDTKAPEFSGRTLRDQPVSLAALRGRVVLLNFWATWCLECRPEMPAFEGLHRRFASRGLAILGINTREDGKAVRRYAEELGLTFPLVLDRDGKIGRLYGVVGLPTTFLIGRDGRAVALAIGPREWGSTAAETIIGSLLTESPGRPPAR
jgi:cytochrome c-type biogenesis protein